MGMPLMAVLSLVKPDLDTNQNNTWKLKSIEILKAATKDN
jgi:hypothetical protein